MKKQLILALFILCSLTSYAQIEGPNPITRNHNLFSRSPNSGLGIKGGVNFANVHGSDADRYGSTDNLTSFHAGIFAQFGVSEVFSVQPELLYTRRGFERQDSVFRFDYLELPILAVFNISDNFSAHLGPQVGIMMSTKQEDQEVNLEPYNTFDYGFAAGLEGKFLERFRLGARYVHGFADLRKEDDAGNSIDQNVKTGVIQVYLGIGF
ncbi:porin family protein [Pontibacter rugosus]|uniref:Porin family protein n=1 Tax=Pontibacter rugosus TaxID=1745966 RepID=A0ABW3SJ24_9BACT